MQATTDTIAINPDALKVYRKKAGYQTQCQLADKLGCKVDQVNRWETGRTKKPRPYLLNKLTEALGVSWEDLTRPPTDEAESWYDPTVQLNRRVGKPTRTALEVVSAIYGVRQRDIIELGPALFHIVAQQSLQARKKALDEAVERVEQAATSANTSVPYMPGAFREYYDYEWIQEEYASIKARCVFESYEDEGGEVYSPFVNHLNQLLAGLTKYEMQVSPHGPWGPKYQFPLEFLQAITGISGEGDTDKAILDAIQDGDLDLQEVRAKKAKLDVNEYQRWLEERYREAEAEREAREEARKGVFAELLGDLQLGQNQDAEKTGGSEGRQ